jgi:hypothetical protein
MIADYDAMLVHVLHHGVAWMDDNSRRRLCLFFVMRLSAGSPTASWMQWKSQRSMSFSVMKLSVDCMSFFCEDAIPWLAEGFQGAKKICRGACLFSVMKLSAGSPTAAWVQWKSQRSLSFFV